MHLYNGRTDGSGTGWTDRDDVCGEDTTNKETEGINLICCIRLGDTKLNFTKLVKTSLDESRAEHIRLS